MAIDAETDGLNALRADLVGISLALEPGRACYVPLRHRGDADLFGGGLVPGQIPLADVLAASGRSARTAASSRSAQNLKYDWLVLSATASRSRRTTTPC